MAKTKPLAKKPAAPFTLKAFQKILERTTDTLKQRIIGRLRNELATKKQLKAFATKEKLKAGLERVEVKLSGHDKNFERMEQKLDHLEKQIVHVVFKEHAPMLETTKSASRN